MRGRSTSPPPRSWPPCSTRPSGRYRSPRRGRAPPAVTRTTAARCTTWPTPCCAPAAAPDRGFRAETTRGFGAERASGEVGEGRGEVVVPHEVQRQQPVQEH